MLLQEAANSAFPCACFLLPRSHCLHILLPKDQGGLGCTKTQGSGILERFSVVVDLFVCLFFVVLRMELGAHRTQGLCT